MAEADLWPSASSEYDTPALIPSHIALPPTHPRGCAKLQNPYMSPTPTAIQSMRERPNAGASSLPALLTSSDINTTTFEPASEGARTSKEPPSPPILRKPPYRTQLQAITNGREHHHQSTQLEKHHRLNQDVDREVESRANQWTAPRTATIGQRHEAHKKAQGHNQGQWSSHADNCTGCGTTMQHLSRLRHHYSMVAKVTEKITESATTQHSLQCLVVPGFLCQTTSASHPNLNPIFIQSVQSPP